MKLTTITNGIDRFLFQPQPVHSVALFRIALGLLLLWNWTILYFDLEVLYGPEGMVSLQTAQHYGNPLRFSLFDFLPNTSKVTTALALVHLAAVIAIILGRWTKTSILIAFITLVSFHHRNGFILNSADSVLRNFLFLLLFTPCADAFSLDMYFKLQQGKAPVEPLEKTPWALRMIQIQFCIIYIATVMFKIKGEQWIDGTAVYTATRLDDFLRFELPLLNSLAVIKFATWSTLLVEIALGTLVWIKELRYWVLLAGIGLHLGIEYTMAIPIFEWAMIAAMICMADPRDVKNWLAKKHTWLKEAQKVS